MSGLFSSPAPRNKRVVYVSSFGAKLDGVADDTIAFQNAMASLVNTGGTVVIDGHLKTVTPLYPTALTAPLVIEIHGTWELASFLIHSNCAIVGKSGGIYGQYQYDVTGYIKITGAGFVTKTFLETQKVYFKNLTIEHTSNFPAITLGTAGALYTLENIEIFSINPGVNAYPFVIDSCFWVFVHNCRFHGLGGADASVLLKRTIEGAEFFYLGLIEFRNLITEGKCIKITSNFTGGAVNTAIKFSFYQVEVPTSPVFVLDTTVSPIFGLIIEEVSAFDPLHPVDFINITGTTGCEITVRNCLTSGASAGIANLISGTGIITKLLIDNVAYNIPLQNVGTLVRLGTEITGIRLGEGSSLSPSLVPGYLEPLPIAYRQNITGSQLDPLGSNTAYNYSTPGIDIPLMVGLPGASTFSSPIIVGDRILIGAWCSNPQSANWIWYCGDDFSGYNPAGTLKQKDLVRRDSQNGQWGIVASICTIISININPFFIVSQFRGSANCSLWKPFCFRVPASIPQAEVDRLFYQLVAKGLSQVNPGNVSMPANVPIQTDAIILGTEINNAPKLLSGATNPEGSIVAPAGSFYLRTGSPGATYTKTTASGNTGWQKLAYANDIYPHADVIATRDRILAAGGTITQDELLAMSSFVNALEARNIWNKFTVFWLCNGDLLGSLEPIKGTRFTCPEVLNLTTNGLKGSTNPIIDTNFLPNATTPITLGIHISEPADSTPRSLLYATNGGNGYAIITVITGGFGQLPGVDGFPNSTIAEGEKGMFSLTLSAAIGRKSFKNGALHATAGLGFAAPNVNLMATAWMRTDFIFSTSNNNPLTDADVAFLYDKLLLFRAAMGRS